MVLDMGENIGYCTKCRPTSRLKLKLFFVSDTVHVICLAVIIKKKSACSFLPDNKERNARALRWFPQNVVGPKQCSPKSRNVLITSLLVSEVNLLPACVYCSRFCTVVGAYVTLS